MYPTGPSVWSHDAYEISPNSSGYNDSYWGFTSTTAGAGHHWGFSPEDDISDIRWPIGVLLISLTILIAFGNTFVVLAVLLERQLRTFENFFFASLAVADLSIALFVLPLSLSVELSDGRWHFGRRACSFFIFVDVSCCTASILHLCTIGLNRYWSISSPLRYSTKQTTRRACATIASVWLLSFVIASPPIFGWPKRTNSVAHQCTYDEDRLYVVCSATGSFYLPLLVMIVVYYKIYRLSKQGAKFRRDQPGTNRNKPGQRPSPHRGDSSCSPRGSTRHYVGSNSSCELVRTSSPTTTTTSRRVDWGKRNRLWSLLCKAAAARRREKKTGLKLAEVKTAKTLGLIMSVFVVCWLPFFLIYVIKPFCSKCHVPVALDRFALWLGYANSLLNPIIYICCKPLFRRTFKKMLLLDYCRITNRYTLQVQCCPAGSQRRRAPCRRRRHVVDSESSSRYRAEYGQLSANVPPGICVEDDRPNCSRDSLNISDGPSGQQAWLSPGVDLGQQSRPRSFLASVDHSFIEDHTKCAPKCRGKALAAGGGGQDNDPACPTSRDGFGSTRTRVAARREGGDKSPAPPMASMERHEGDGVRDKDSQHWAGPLTRYDLGLRYQHCRSFCSSSCQSSYSKTSSTEASVKSPVPDASDPDQAPLAIETSDSTVIVDDENVSVDISYHVPGAGGGLELELKGPETGQVVNKGTQQGETAL